MQFKTNHSPGPWALDDYDDGRLAYINTMSFNIAISGTDRDILLCIAAPKMLEYMMDRANCIEKEICLGVCYDPDGSKEELQTILSILKDAGIDVVEK